LPLVVLCVATTGVELETLEIAGARLDDAALPLCEEPPPPQPAISSAGNRSTAIRMGRP